MPGPSAPGPSGPSLLVWALIGSLATAVLVGTAMFFFLPRTPRPRTSSQAADATVAPLELGHAGPGGKAQSLPASNSVWMVLGEDETWHGLSHITTEPDGLTAQTTIDGRPCRSMDFPPEYKAGNRRAGYAYFSIGPDFKQAGAQSVRVEIELLSVVPARLALQYDALATPETPRSKYLQAGSSVRLPASRTWQTVVFHLRHAAFENSQNGHADFRLDVLPPELFMRRVTVSREPVGGLTKSWVELPPPTAGLADDPSPGLRPSLEEGSTPESEDLNTAPHTPPFRSPALASLNSTLPRFKADWPQFLGPTRDGAYAGPALLEQWPAQGPRVVWSAAVGEGYASPVVAEGRVIISHRLGSDLVVDCLHPGTGEKLWRFTHAMKFTDGAHYDNGPRPTPAVKSGRVFVHNTDGYLVCLDLNTGEKIWSRRPKSEFHSSATWHGCVASPLVTDQAVLLPVGGDAGVAAFACADGKPLWQTPADKLSASSPVLALVEGHPRLLVLTRSNLACLLPDTGQIAWQLPTRPQSAGNVYAASPVGAGDNIFLSGWYDLGALWLAVTNGQPRTIWQRDDALSTHFATAILYQGHAYGFHGHAWEAGGPKLRCIELATGQMTWEQPQLGGGTVVRAGDDLLVLTDRGELLLAKADPGRFSIQSRAQVTGRTTRSYPAIADGYVYIRGPRQLLCLDLRGQKDT